MVPKICLAITAIVGIAELILFRKHYHEAFSIIPIVADLIATVVNLFIIINSELLKYETNYSEIGKV